MLKFSCFDSGAVPGHTTARVLPLLGANGSKVKRALCRTAPCCVHAVLLGAAVQMHRDTQIRCERCLGQQRGILCCSTGGGAVKNLPLCARGCSEMASKPWGWKRGRAGGLLTTSDGSCAKRLSRGAGCKEGTGTWHCTEQVAPPPMAALPHSSLHLLPLTAALCYGPAAFGAMRCQETNPTRSSTNVQNSSGLLSA